VTPESIHIYSEAVEISDDELAEVGTILSMWRPFRISAYKDKCMKRRVAIRMRSTRCRTVSEYCHLLRQSPQELDQLQKALTIHVSQFFRNPSTFEKLRIQVLPELYRSCRAAGRNNLRIWCLGCATGEEPYTLAILLREYFGKEMREIRTSIHGTDIDEETIRSARTGEFSEDRLKEMPPDLCSRYLKRVGQRYRLSPEICQMVEFVRGDITDTAGFVPSDLVLCRNTLIYFTRQDQEKILHGIADILPPGGILVLGKSETLPGSIRRRFETVCPQERIYRLIQ
jgi:chemotaxis protein methyltransferase CheR